MSEEAITNELQIIQDSNQKYITAGMMTYRTERELSELTKKKESITTEVSEVTSTIEHKNTQRISSQAILQENCKQLIALLEEFQEPSIQAICQQLEERQVSQALVAAMSDYFQKAINAMESQHADQEALIQSLRSERDSLMRTKQASEVELELVKKTIAMDVSKLQAAIQDQERKMEVDTMTHAQ